MNSLPFLDTVMLVSSTINGTLNKSGMLTRLSLALKKTVPETWSCTSKKLTPESILMNSFCDMPMTKPSKWLPLNCSKGLLKTGAPGAINGNVFKQSSRFWSSEVRPDSTT